MKITLIEPAMIKTSSFGEKPAWMLPPLTLATLAGLTPDGIEVQAVDDRLETIDYDEARDLVGISVKTFTARRAYQIADEFRKRGVRVVLGGHHPTLLPEEALEHADAILTGEAEGGVWSQLLADAKHDRLKKIYKQDATLPFEKNHPDYSIFEGKKYLPVAMVETTRGCPFSCSFCSVTTFFGRGFRHRPPDEVVSHVRALNKPFYFFVDDNIVADKEAAKELFRALIPLKIRWISQASLTMTKDRELMRLMHESGCAGVLVGIESIDKANLKQIHKSWNTVGIGYDEALRIARDHGISIVGSFVLGMDEDSPESLDLMLEFAVRQRLFAALFNVLTPYPGTDLYNEMLTAGRLTQPRWWVDPNFKYGTPVFEPRKISSQGLAQKRMEMYKKFYGVKSTFYRLFDFSSNVQDAWHLFTYLGMNLPAYREESQRAQQALGLG
jgi:radical SAM superfamily enzyme YgiQ (UPF0313 family)